MKFAGCNSFTDYSYASNPRCYSSTKEISGFYPRAPIRGLEGGSVGLSPLVQLLSGLFLRSAHTLNRIEPVWFGDLSRLLSGAGGVAAGNCGEA